MAYSLIKVLAAILPVIGMILVGVFLRKAQWISRKGIDDIKFLVSRIMLTVAAFHALATGEYTSKIAVLVGVLLISKLYEGDLQFIMAEVIYMSVPTTFSMQTYIKNPEGCSYVSTTNSIYMIITILVYAICAFIYHLQV